jgi:hypothetical protein
MLVCLIICFLPFSFCVFHHTQHDFGATFSLFPGLLLTVAMFGTLLSVTYLGQGVGNSLIQAKILVRYDH